MHFLLDANLPRRAALTLRQLGHQADDVRDIGLTSAPDDKIASHARSHHLTLVTRDFGFADIRNYPPVEYGGIIVLDLSERAPVDEVCGVLARFVSGPRVAQVLPGRLAIVRADRVRFRPRL
jgi:hypothetical protein